MQFVTLPIQTLLGLLLTPQAFEIIARPALDSFEAALDRTKMAIYSRFAEWGLPCPITGKPGSIGQEVR